MLLTVLIVLPSLLAASQTQLEDCVRKNEVQIFPELDSACCEQNQMLIRRNDGKYRCMTDPCLEPDPSIPKKLFYSGRCEDVFGDAVCGEEAVGERLYLGEDGLGYCDCDEGWLRYEGRCYQEFSPAFCPDNQILFFKPPEKKPTIFPEDLKLYIDGFKLNFSCKPNPCRASYLPHSLTWSSNSYCHAVKLDQVSGCEMFVSDLERDGSELVCCPPSKRSLCQVQYTFTEGFTLLSLAPLARR